MLTIRHASVNDIDLIRDLCRQVWPQTYSGIISQEQIKYMLEMMYSEKALFQQMNEQHYFIIIYNTGVPVGFASYSEIAPMIYKLHKLYILQNQQGRGIGKYAIEHIIKNISVNGATVLQLNVNRNNSAKTFYEKHGFTVIRTEDIDIGNGFFMNDYIMEKKLVSLPNSPGDKSQK